MTKLQRQNKIRENRTIYLSWREGEETTVAWVTKFWDRIDFYSPQFPVKIGRTDRAAGERLNVSVDEVLSDVTEFVAVVTLAYLKANRDPKKPLEREFARFLEMMEQDGTDKHGRRALLAPLEKLSFDWIELGGVKLTGKDWLVPLRNPRFTIPVNDDEIEDAVVMVLNAEKKKDKKR
jgi:hypothetical protein